MKYLNINRLLLVICISAAGTVHTSAQSSVDEILKQIESNNPTLKAAAAQAEAQRLENRSGALPAFGLPCGGIWQVFREWRIKRSACCMAFAYA